MHTLLAMMIFVGGIFALNLPADAAHKSKRSAKPPYAYQPKVNLACEERARAEIPRASLRATLVGLARPSPEVRTSTGADLGASRKSSPLEQPPTLSVRRPPLIGLGFYPIPAWA